MALGTGSCGTPQPVDVLEGVSGRPASPREAGLPTLLRVGRHTSLDDRGNVLDVDTTCHDVGGEENATRSVLELFNSLGSPALAETGVNLPRGVVELQFGEDVVVQRGGSSGRKEHHDCSLAHFDSKVTHLWHWGTSSSPAGRRAESMESGSPMST